MALSLDDLETRYAAPFGTYALSRAAQARIARARRHRGRWTQNLVRSLARRHLRATGEIADIEYRSCRLRLLPGENTDDMALVLHGEHPELDELELFEQRIAGTTCFVDIGANIGVYSVIAARHMAPGARIVAVEPHPRTGVKLRANALLNGIETMTLVDKALGAQDGTALLRVMSRKNAGANTLRPGGREDGEAVEVPVVPLLSELTALGVTHIDLLKIDVEGMEDTVLLPFFDTAPQSLWPHYIMLEIIARRDWPRDVCDTLLRLGYEQAFENEMNAHYRLRTDTQNDEDKTDG